MPNRTAPGRPRQRIIDAALRLTAERGYDGVQVRAISELAGVSSRTIYGNFSSLDALILIAVGEQATHLYRRYVRTPPQGSDAAGRVAQLASELTATMSANRELTIAVMRALLGGKPDIARFLPEFGDALREMLAVAIAPDGPSAHDRETADFLAGIWLSAVIDWTAGTATDNRVRDVVHDAARTLLPT